MKRMGRTVMLATAMLWLQAEMVMAVPLGSIRLEVTGISPISGTLLVALHDNADSLDGNGRPVRVWRARVTAERMQIAFDDLTPGYYAIAVYQDVNQNGELDRAAFGVPAEPVGFSNNVMGRRGPPDFRDAAFLVDSADIPHTIRLVAMTGAQ